MPAVDADEVPRTPPHLTVSSPVTDRDAGREVSELRGERASSEIPRWNVPSLALVCCQNRVGFLAGELAGQGKTSLAAEAGRFIWCSGLEPDDAGAGLPRRRHLQSTQSDRALSTSGCSG